MTYATNASYILSAEGGIEFLYVSNFISFSISVLKEGITVPSYSSIYNYISTVFWFVFASHYFATWLSVHAI